VAGLRPFALIAPGIVNCSQLCLYSDFRIICDGCFSLMIRETYAYSVQNNPLFLKMPVRFLQRLSLCVHQATFLMANSNTYTGMAVYRHMHECVRHGSMLRCSDVRSPKLSLYSAFAASSHRCLSLMFVFGINKCRLFAFVFFGWKLNAVVRQGGSFYLFYPNINGHDYSMTSLQLLHR
jgi:hypothetical protein